MFSVETFNQLRQSVREKCLAVPSTLDVVSIAAVEARIYYIQQYVTGIQKTLNRLTAEKREIPTDNTEAHEAAEKKIKYISDALQSYIASQIQAIKTYIQGYPNVTLESVSDAEIGKACSIQRSFYLRQSKSAAEYALLSDQLVGQEAIYKGLFEQQEASKVLNTAVLQNLLGVKDDGSETQMARWIKGLDEVQCELLQLSVSVGAYRALTELEKLQLCVTGDVERKAVAEKKALRDQVRQALTSPDLPDTEYPEVMAAALKAKSTVDQVMLLVKHRAIIKKAAKGAKDPLGDFISPAEGVALRKILDALIENLTLLKEDSNLTVKEKAFINLQLNLQTERLAALDASLKVSLVVYAKAFVTKQDPFEAYCKRVGALSHYRFSDDFAQLREGYLPRFQTSPESIAEILKIFQVKFTVAEDYPEGHWTCDAALSRHEFDAIKQAFLPLAFSVIPGLPVRTAVSPAEMSIFVENPFLLQALTVLNRPVSDALTIKERIQLFYDTKEAFSLLGGLDISEPNFWGRWLRGPSGLSGFFQERFTLAGSRLKADDVLKSALNNLTHTARMMLKGEPENFKVLQKDFTENLKRTIEFCVKNKLFFSWETFIKESMSVIEFSALPPPNMRALSLCLWEAIKTLDQENLIRQEGEKQFLWLTYTHPVFWGMSLDKTVIDKDCFDTEVNNVQKQFFQSIHEALLEAKAAYALLERDQAKINARFINLENFTTCCTDIPSLCEFLATQCSTDNNTVRFMGAAGNCLKAALEKRGLGCVAEALFDKKDPHRKQLLTRMDSISKRDLATWKQKVDEAPRVDMVRVKTPHQAVAVVGDGNCLFYSVIMGYLGPVISKSDEFTTRAERLFGSGLTEDNLARLKTFVCDSGDTRGPAYLPVRALVNTKMRPLVLAQFNSADPNNAVRGLGESTERKQILTAITTADAYVGTEAMYLTEKLLGVKIICHNTSGGVSYGEAATGERAIHIIHCPAQSQTTSGSTHANHYDWFPTHEAHHAFHVAKTAAEHPLDVRMSSDSGRSSPALTETDASSVSAMSSRSRGSSFADSDVLDSTKGRGESVAYNVELGEFLKEYQQSLVQKAFPVQVTKMIALAEAAYGARKKDHPHFVAAMHEAALKKPKNKQQYQALGGFLETYPNNLHLTQDNISEYFRLLLNALSSDNTFNAFSFDNRRIQALMRSLVEHGLVVTPQAGWSLKTMADVDRYFNAKAHNAYYETGVFNIEPGLKLKVEVTESMCHEALYDETFPKNLPMVGHIKVIELRDVDSYTSSQKSMIAEFANNLLKSHLLERLAPDQNGLSLLHQNTEMCGKAKINIAGSGIITEKVYSKFLDDMNCQWNCAIQGMDPKQAFDLIKSMVQQGHVVYPYLGCRLASEADVDQFLKAVPFPPPFVPDEFSIIPSEAMRQAVIAEAKEVMSGASAPEAAQTSGIVTVFRDLAMNDDDNSKAGNRAATSMARFM